MSSQTLEHLEPGLAQITLRAPNVSSGGPPGFFVAVSLLPV
jgi:hypothetical protein